MTEEQPAPPLKSRLSKVGGKTKSQLQDDSIMGTNNSSIVSKRSVERLYFPNEAHFFRHFVKKPLRRSPLINRGYWLRMKAIDTVVRQFLEHPSSKRKVVINLGCGYDPLPWQCLTRYPSASKNAKFIDIDYQDLMIKKRNAVLATNQLTSVFTNVEESSGDMLFQSDQYLQIGCDLRDLVSLQGALEKAVDVNETRILLVAEVSITYMDLKSADALIEWAGKLPDARFCLLEQLMPAGDQHPFAKTMMAHFNNLQTPLRPVQRYPTTSAQEARFRNLGWSDATARNLWEVWAAADFITLEERKSLDSVEPFDEWEELALFGCHYVLLVASTSSLQEGPILLPKKNGPNLHQDAPLVSKSVRVETTYSQYPKGHGFQRFASALPIRGSHPSRELFGIFGGMGLNTRVNTIDVYGKEEDIPFVPTPDAVSISPPSRMCHTTTDLGDAGTLLVGGRTSPDAALADCWLYHKWLGVWERVSDLPKPRYRHGAVNLGHGYVLLSLGRPDSRTISNDFLIWHRRTGWLTCEHQSGMPSPAVYGSVFLSDTHGATNDPSEPRSGILAGGINEDGVVQDSVWRWQLSGLASGNPMISFQRMDELNDRFPVSRFGASTVNSNGTTYILGGIVRDRLLESHEEMCSVAYENGGYSIKPIILEHFETVRPLLIGMTIARTPDSLVLSGGSAVCFSFGTFWNKGCYTLPGLEKVDSPNHFMAQQPIRQEAAWRYLHTIVASVPGKAKKVPIGLPATASDPANRLSIVPRLRLHSPADFDQVVKAGKPIILEGLDIGKCTSNWTAAYLKERIGAEREVIVHESSTEAMNFVTKNFSYTTKRFGAFLDEVTSGARLYLRSLSSEKPSELPADIARDFTSIAADFKIPPELDLVRENMHSSPLRISGGVSMWLHYDVMANILCQVQGAKRLLLFPPSDVRYFGFEPGSSSSSADVLNNLADYGLAHPHEVLLGPGDILYLPPLWLHAASPREDGGAGMNVSVNVFFRNLNSGYAAGRDVYGNRDLQAYEKGRQDIQRIVKSFDGLHADVREFYLQRLADEFEGKAR